MSRKFEGFFADNYAKAMFLACKLIPEPDAEQIVLDSFVILWSKWADFDRPEQARAFFFKSVKNACLNERRHQSTKYRATYSLDTVYNLEDDQEEPDYLGINAEIIHRLYNQIKQLSEMKRNVLFLFLIGKTSQEMATILGVNINTIRNTKMQAIDQLKKRFKIQHHAK